jgi:nitrogenase molybdenum-cofactor synthesis protein NifE
MMEKDVDLLIGGVKERPIAYKMGSAFCDHNHERKIALAGFEGMRHFCREVNASIMSPVWQFSPARQKRSSLRKVEDDRSERNKRVVLS